MSDDILPLVMSQLSLHECQTSREFHVIIATRTALSTDVGNVSFRLHTSNVCVCVCGGLFVLADCTSFTVEDSVDVKLGWEQISQESLISAFGAADLSCGLT